MPLKRAIPNALTVLRVLSIIPILIYFFQRNYAAALAWMVYGASTDLLDGYLARRWNVTSHFGALMDPIADKLFVGLIFAALASQNICPRWFAAFLLTCFLLQLSAFLYLKFPRVPAKRPLSVSSLGKVNSAVQMFWMMMLLTLSAAFPSTNLLMGWHGYFFLLGYGALAAIQVYVLFQYFSKFRHLILPWTSKSLVS